LCHPPQGKNYKNYIGFKTSYLKYDGILELDLIFYRNKKSREGTMNPPPAFV
jgi:hypothetical protein